MKKRIFAAFLWFYTGWYGGAILSEFLGVNPVLGPLIGAAAAALFVGDPRRIIWTTKSIAPSIAARAGAIAAASHVSNGSADTEVYR
ncbi:MAG TPA: hypothetical protein VGQ89_09620 [Candidatus Limnocylindrales bacterium]|jgi:hypothetical protein|nr:hypothetical protein [Candidatus Limnocylindrales bacterium]